MESQGPTSFFVPSVPDQWELCEQAVFLPPAEAELEPDKLWASLEGVERSTEQFIPTDQDVLVDAKPNFLDIAEASAEKHQDTGKFFLPDGMLDKVESSVEQQELKPDVFEEETVTLEDDYVVLQDDVSRGPLLNGGATFFTRGHRIPMRHMHGSKTGLKRNDGVAGIGEIWWCPVYNEPSDPELCERCDFYEEDPDSETGFYCSYYE